MRLETVTTVALLACGVLLVSSLAPDGAIGTRAVPAEVRAKQARILDVAADLAARDVSALTPAQIEARRQNLARLRAYAEQGVFTRNDESPDRDIPYFVDSAGTRCALAHLVESGGRGDLLASLVRDVNNAWISEIDGDPDLGAWLAENGFTVEEVAYIQAPGLVDPQAPAVPSGPAPDGTGDGGSGGFTPVGGGSGGFTPAGGTGGTTPRPSPTGVGPARRSGGTTPRARRTTTASASWETWWILNGDALANPRTAYHDQSGTTPGPVPGATPVRPQRPTSAEIERDIIPVLDRAAASDDLRLAATGIMSLARASTPARDGTAVNRILTYLAKPSAPYRNFAVLALGIVPDPAAVAPLRNILLDKSEGRALLGETEKIGEHLRALAALALGRCGGEQAATDLMALLGDGSKEGTDLRVAAVTALGLLSADVTAQKRINPFLLAHLEDSGWMPVVAAQVPIALARSQDRTVLPALLAVIDRFKGPREVRQSAATAVGLLGDGLTPELVGPLMAMAQRDPDSTSRQFAIMALAELAARDPDPAADAPKARADLMRKVSVFFVDGVGDAPRQAADRPWYAIAGALFARKYDHFKPAIAKALIRLADDGAARDDRAAAALGLGLIRGGSANEALRRLIGSTTEPKVVAYAAESLGMHADASMKDRLVEMSKNATDDAVRYRAVLGLARLRETGLIPTFVAALAESRSQTVQAALTRAIGTIGDKSAIESLARLAADPDQDRAARERALGALGLIGQRGDTAWSMDVKRGCNFMADAPALRTVLSTF